MIEITRLPAGKDNYIWLLVDLCTRHALVVDPGQASAVLDILEAHQYTLQGILITHHHRDHTAGVIELVNKTKAPVYGSALEPIPGLTHSLRNESTLDLLSMDLTAEILYVPGHTLGHVAYLIENKLFCGDTLFTAGCGRIFEGTPLQMFTSLGLLKSLDPAIEIYCGHEYTLSNLQFACQVEPNNSDIQNRLEIIEQQRHAQQATVPALLSIELKTNPFLRCHIPAVRKSVEHHFQLSFHSELEIFTALRYWKDSFTA